MTKKLEILKGSLEKKQLAFDEKLSAHFGDVKSANGQPLNDKRGGGSTLKRWENQNNALRTLKDGIQKTSNAIEKEQNKLDGVEYVNKRMPSEILEMVESGELIQWKRHPESFFVKGVDRARIVWIKKSKEVGFRYGNEIPTQEQKDKFFEIFNQLSKVFNKKLKDLP